MTLKAVLFDLGGTLLHYHDPESTEPERPFRRITQVGVGQLVHRLRAEGAPFNDPDSIGAVLDRHIGESYRLSQKDLRGGCVEAPIRAALAELGVEVDDVRWSSLRAEFYRAIDTIVTPRVGMHETLAALRTAGYQIGLISNTYWAADLHDRHLAEHGLDRYFDVRVYSSETPHCKPHPEIFTITLAMLGVQPGEAAYVGDRPDIDVAAAQQVGMWGILIHSPFMTTPLGSVIPDAAIEELPELPPALERLKAPA